MQRKLFWQFLIIMSITLCLSSCTIPIDDDDDTVYYTVTFIYGDGRAPLINKVAENQEVDYPEEPERDGYRFDAWYRDSNYEFPFYFNTKIKYDLKLYAKWNEYSAFSITYHLDGGKEEGLIRGYDSTRLTEIQLVNATKEGYFFKGYYDNPNFSGNCVKKITLDQTGDLTLHAKFVPKRLENATISFLGDSITTFDGYIPSGYTPYYPLYSSTVKNVNDTWWMQTLLATNASLGSNSSYGGSTVIGTGTTAASSKTRIENLSTSSPDPNIIIVYIGVNDFLASYNVTTFEATYQKMIENIQNRYHGVDIFICTLPYERYSVEKDPLLPPLRYQYNQVIAKIATNYQLGLIDFQDLITATNADMYLGDRVHPNKAGMTLLANQAIAALQAFYRQN